MESESLEARYNPSSSTERILVVGDWVVDEHWVIGVHRSPTSSRTGREHYRALHPANSTVESLCGAGRTASVLEQATHGEDKFCEVIGIGVWHEKDTEALTCLLDPTKDKPHAPHRLTRDKEEVCKERLFNLCKVLNKVRGDGLQEFGTTRMIRIYQHTGAKFELLQRIDWELQISSSETVSVQSKTQLKESDDEPVLFSCQEDINDPDLDKFISQYRDSIRAVVIKDMRKGVICEAMVNWMAKTFNNVPWFISTKSWHPKWLDNLEQVDVRLLVIPQIAAQWAIRNNELNRWVTQSGDASSGALKIMDKLGRKFKNAIIVALPDGLQVLARGPAKPGEEDKRKGIMQVNKGPRRLAMGLPMASVFFPALVVDMMINREIKLDRFLEDALRFTHRWMSIEVGRVENPEEWKPSKDQFLKLNSSGGKTERDDIKPFEGNWKDFPWDQAMNNWESAFSRYGIIEAEGKKYLELWRAMTEVEGYVCCVKSKRTLLQTVVNELKSFEKEPKSCMFIASPGSGKTFLVRRLADTLRLRYLGFNITQMISKNDLLDCFDTIVTNQAQNKEESLLVFFDEINAKLDGQHVYDAFLAPLEEGVYVRGGKTFHIDPCVWVFAGTERPLPEGESKYDKSDKASDFESRLTLEPLDLRIDLKKKDGYEQESEARTENVYLSVSLLRSIFPDVRKISKKVLQAFHTIPPDTDARELRNFIRAFTSIQYSEVKAKNIHKERFKKLCGNITNWNDQPEIEGDIVEIKG